MNDKITLEELSPSLQNLLKNAPVRDEISSLNTRASKLIDLLANVRFNIVDDLSEILTPTNGKDMVVCGSGNNYKLYFYYNNKWNHIPTASIDLNKEYTVVVQQSEHQTITVEYNGNYYTRTFKAKINNLLKVSIIAEEGYIAGELSCDASFAVIEDITISATPATEIPKYNIDVTPVSNQSIEITYDGNVYKDTDVLNIPNRSTFSVALIPDYGYYAGEVTVSDGSAPLYENTYVIVNNTEVTASPATRRIFNVSIPFVTNQYIIFKYIDPDSGEEHTTQVSTEAKVIPVPYNSEILVTAVGMNGYMPGDLNITSGHVTSNITITITNAKTTYNKEIFDDPTVEYRWVPPNYITKIRLRLAGAGGGAHSEIIEEETGALGYFNGGNGELIETILPINIEESYTLKVGKAGTTFESSGEPSIGFDITANGGSLDGTDAGNGKGGKGDTIVYQTGVIVRPAENGYITIEYGTNIEKEEVGS